MGVLSHMPSRISLADTENQGPTLSTLVSYFLEYFICFLKRPSPFSAVIDSYFHEICFRFGFGGYTTKPNPRRPHSNGFWSLVWPRTISVTRHSFFLCKGLRHPLLMFWSAFHYYKKCLRWTTYKDKKKTYLSLWPWRVQAMVTYHDRIIWSSKTSNLMSRGIKKQRRGVSQMA